MKVKSLSCVRLATPWTAAYQAPPSMGFSRQGYWSGVPLPSPDWSLTLTEISLGPPRNQNSLVMHKLSPAAAAAKSFQSCPTLSDPMDCSLPDSSIHGIFQARVLEWVAIVFSIITYCYLAKKKKTLFLKQTSYIFL